MFWTSQRPKTFERHQTIWKSTDVPVFKTETELVFYMQMHLNTIIYFHYQVSGEINSQSLLERLGRDSRRSISPHILLLLLDSSATAAKTASAIRYYLPFRGNTIKLAVTNTRGMDNFTGNLKNSRRGPPMGIDWNSSSTMFHLHILQNKRCTETSWVQASTHLCIVRRRQSAASHNRCGSSLTFFPLSLALFRKHFCPSGV